MKIDKGTIHKIRDDLSEITGSMELKVATDPKMDMTTCIDYRDRDYICRLNPKKIHTQKQLDKAVDIFRSGLSS